VPQKYVLAGATGATLLNLPDVKSHEVLRVAGGTPLAVYPYRKGIGYLRVRAPGGLKVWVFGKYLSESARPGWLEVSGSYVNMRPRPQSADSYPIGQLDRGDRLRFIQRKNPDKPMSEDWVQVFSPPDAMGYVLAAETRALPAGANPKVLWEAAVKKSLAASSKAAPGPAAGSNTRAVEAASNAVQLGAPSQGLFAELAAANAEMDTALAGAAPDYDKLYANYQALLARSPDAPTRSLIQERIKRLDLSRELGEIRAEYELQNAEREKQLEELRDEVQQDRRGRDPLWGRFQTRGWLEQQEQDGKTVYLIRWGADTLAQVQCSSGRYDLDLYDGVEIGAQGVTVPASEAASSAYPLIDIDSIEVISVRLR